MPPYGSLLVSSMWGKKIYAAIWFSVGIADVVKTIHAEIRLVVRRVGVGKTIYADVWLSDGIVDVEKDDACCRLVRCWFRRCRLVFCWYRRCVKTIHVDVWVAVGIADVKKYDTWRCMVRCGYPACPLLRGCLSG